MSSVIVMVISYLLGSIPFGYIFSRISGKDVLKIGWRKTSGSNVFRNIGLWQGIFTGLGDISKGFLAVYLAQKLGASPQIQVFSGLAAVFGNNYSVFLKFAGGRGIGTFIGAFSAFNPQLLGLAIIPAVALALIWNAAIGTIFFLACLIYLANYFDQFETLGFFVLPSLFPILFKRLSPIGELFLSPLKFSEKFGRVKKKEIIFNRLLFDDDISRFDLRIKRIIDWLTKREKLLKWW